MPRQKPKHEDRDPEESKRFTDAVRELGGDVDEATFERAFTRVARSKSGKAEKTLQSRKRG
jgi:hypothetical protein